MAGSCDYVKLLLFCQVDEFYCISGYTDREVCVLFFLRMIHRVDQLLCAEYVHIEVMCTLCEVAIQYANQILGTLFVAVTECIRVDRLCIGDSVKCILIRKLCDGVQRCKQSVLLCAGARVCARRKRLTCFSSIRKGAGCLAINNV